MVSFLKCTVIVALAFIATTTRTQVDVRIAAMSGTRIRGNLTNSSFDEAKSTRAREYGRLAAMSVTSSRDGLTNSSIDGTKPLNSATQLAVKEEERLGGQWMPSVFGRRPSVATPVQLDGRMANSGLDYAQFAGGRADRLAESSKMPKVTFADHKKFVESRKARLAASVDLPAQSLGDYAKFAERRRARLARTHNVPKETVADYLKSVGRRAAHLAEPQDKPATVKSKRGFWNAVKRTFGARSK